MKSGKKFSPIKLFIHHLFIMKIQTKDGEVEVKYLAGAPKQYRFDAKSGDFNVGGDKSATFKELTIHPIAWRFFEDDILAMGRKKWVELFFLDDRNCLSAILFHGFSEESLRRLAEPLYYDDMTLGDVILTVTAERKENSKVTPKAVYYIAKFEYVSANHAQKELAKSVVEACGGLYRRETITGNAEISAMQGMNSQILLGSGE
jgi:hypothetical protein